ncbi:hypothetical protein F4678DRAFT_152265 [Xylaria arbuscula]|nr:hypothetical protein F4678DRAFT_152265 [Xylaria arbuscula]
MMEGENNTRTLFPSTWTLGYNNFSYATQAQETTRLGAYPGGWSLSAIQESVSDTTEAPSQTNTARSESSFAPSDTQVPTSTELSPASFKTSWTLPLTAKLHQSTSTPTDHERLFSSDWSLSPIRHRPCEKDAVASVNGPDIVGVVPGHVIPRATPSSGQEVITPIMGDPASVVPGNFQPSGYSDARVTPQSNLRSASIKSSRWSTNGMSRHPVGYNYDASSNSDTSLHSRDGLPVHVRFAPIHKTTSESSSNLRASHSLPTLRNSGLYQIPRPAAFVSDHTTPQSIQNSPRSSQSYHLPRPVGFEPENITPPISNMSTQSIQSPANPEEGYLVIGSPPRDPLPQSPMMSLVAADIPVQATTLPTTDRLSWLYTDGEQLYRIS